MDQMKRFKHVLATVVGAILCVFGNQTLAGSKIYFIHSDHLNTPQVITNTNQQVVWKVENQSPFGEAEIDQDPDGDGEELVFNLRFPGQYLDAETGLYYNYFRDYDPTTGRYIQSDPIGLQGGINTYAYVGNNPVKYIDPFGLDYWFAQASASGVVSVGGEGAVGGFYNTDTGSFDTYVDYGPGAGFDVDVGFAVGYYWGENFYGYSNSINVDVTFVSVDIKYDPYTGMPVGIDVGLGLIPWVGFSNTFGTTTPIPTPDSPIPEPPMPGPDCP